MESNDNLEQLLRQMYAQESHHDEDIDTSDIIDEEWTKFEAEHFKDGRYSNSSILSFYKEDSSPIYWRADIVGNHLCRYPHD